MKDFKKNIIAIPSPSLAPRALQDFRRMIDRADGFLDLLANPDTDFRFKSMDYTKVKDEVFEFCRYYAKWLGNPLMERLKAEIYQLLEEAIGWWGQQEIFDIMEK